MDADGNSLFAISDVGGWLSADINYDGRAPGAACGARIGPLLAAGRPILLSGKREQDAEVARAARWHPDDAAPLLIGFERVHRIGRFEIRDREVHAPSGYLRLPPEARRMSPTRGWKPWPCSRPVRCKGSVVAFAERFTRGSGYHTGWIWMGGEPQGFQLRDIDGFNITDAAGLPDGGLLVLERCFRWMEGVKMRIRRLAVAEIKPGARLTGGC